MKKVPGPYIVTESHSPPPLYDRPPEYEKMKQERDVLVPMRDGVQLCVDIYRPDAQGKFPALLALSRHNKDLQTPEACENSGPQPSWSPFWQGAQESGDTRYFVSRGYVHIVGNPRGVGKSEDAGSPKNDSYDLIEWIARQPWCDGNVGMVGISNFARYQWLAAMQQPPHLKAIFPYDANRAYDFRDTNVGGILSVMNYLISQLGVEHEVRERPGPLPPEVERLWEEAMRNPDYRMYGHFFNVLTQKGQHTPSFFNLLLNPFDKKETVTSTEANFAKIKVPVYTGAGWYAYTYKTHLQGCQHYYWGIKVPKKLLFTGPGHLERPFHSFHNEILKWYDYWLKGIDTGIMNEPVVKMWVMGANRWYYADDWPVPETKWTKFYLHGWERLRAEPFTPSSRDGYNEPDAFVQMPPSQTRTVQKLRYMTDPLPEDTLIAGPSALYLHASIDQPDTNWIVVLKDVGPDVSVRTAREGETAIPDDLCERELVRGWLKASHRALDPERSKPWKPWHPLTKEASKPVVPAEINEYAIEILSTANLFKQGHRICVEITSMDVPTGTAGFTNVEYIPYHVCSSRTTLHKIYHSEKYPSYLLLPIIPKGDLE
ncbi:CocE/NonD family hydrolase [Thermodesulfobacteriota bacterium]